MNTRSLRRPLIQRSLLALALGLTAPVWAQAAKWPAKPIKIIVAFPHGGLTDAYARNDGDYPQRLARRSARLDQAGGGLGHQAGLKQWLCPV